MNDRLKEQFRNPGADKRSIPFWAWNGKMDEEELRMQVRQMKQAGVGGFFIHSRIGLETEYLGTEWMNCVKAVVAEAKAQGLYAWIYDEDRWPSGTAGGRVTSCGDAYRCKGLTLEIRNAEDYDKLYREEIQPRRNPQDDSTGFLAAYRATISGERVINYARLALQRDELFSDGEVLLVVRLEVSAPSEWFNNEAPPDNLNPDCVRKFIQETHEKYKQAVGEEFGKTVPGFFTDEPSLNDRFSYFGEHKSWIPWTYGYAAYFAGLCGYDFFEVLPLFYFHGEGSAKIRHDYWRSITQRYGESYFKVLGQWCDENNLLFTGHFLQEDKLGLCTRVNGAVMPNYQYMHIPGIDMLCEQTDEFMTVKQCTSVAHQLGKKQVLSETYGCTGWEFTFEGQKWIGDWQYVLGVNRRCQHLMHYSLRGCRKRDYPPSFNYNTNWWKENKIVDDYFARLSVVLEQGDAVRNILVLHPASTAWSRMGVNPYGNPRRREERDVPGINAYGSQLNTLIEYLERQHLDCDLGDELLMKQYGQVASGELVIGRAGYQAVVLPPVDTMLYATCTKLIDYMEQGGFVYAMTPYPFMVEGSAKEKAVYEKMVFHKHWIAVSNREELAKQLIPYRTIMIEAGDGQECGDVLYQLRKEGDEYYLFLVNNNRCKEVDVTVKLPFPAVPMRMNPLSGEITEESGYENGAHGIRLRVHLDKTGSVIFYLKEMKTERTGYGGPFSYGLDHRNVLPLDMCRYRMEGGEWSKEQELWKIQKEIREALHMQPIHHNGIEQRYKWIDKPNPGNGCQIELAFHFVSKQPLRNIAIAMERPEDFTLILNGREIPWETEGWLLDKEIQRSNLSELLQGDNQLILRCLYRNDMELENIYLEGEFGVDKERCLTELPAMLSIGSWTEQGLKHYCGSVTYRMEYVLEDNGYSANGRVWLELPPMEAVCVKVRVNGQETLLPWNFERDISIEKWLCPGINQIEIEVVGSPRNMMGPFHIKEKPKNTNDASFCPSEEKYSADYLLVPYGIMGEIVLVKEIPLQD